MNKLLKNKWFWIVIVVLGVIGSFSGSKTSSTKTASPSTKSESVQGSVSETKTSSLPGENKSSAYAEKDPTDVAFCFAFLGVNEDPSLATLSAPQKLFVKDNSEVFTSKVLPSINRFQNCMGNDSSSEKRKKCSEANPGDDAMMLAIVNGARVRNKGPQEDRTAASQACFAKDAVLRLKQ